MTKNKRLLSLLFFVPFGIQAQDATTASGGDASGTGGSAAYSVGQAVYTSIETALGSVNQGVQQPYDIMATGVNNHPDIDLSMSVYPNPSITTLNLNTGKQDLKDLSFQLYDVQGKLVLQQKITSVITSIKMEEYNTGNYFLKVISSTTELKTFKIIKN